MNTTRVPPIFVRADLAIAIALGVAAFLVFLPNTSNEFSNVDDSEYVTENEMVKRGVTLEGIRWAVTSQHFYNWLPATTLSHMLDVELFGLNPAGHHLTNILLHALNAALAYFALRSLTTQRWPSAAVALLFAVHPLRVESVAWLAERKDLLAGMFFFLVLIAYTRYVYRPGLARYLLVLGLLALGLMSKTMLVTLPCLLLVLDWWPLRRIQLSRFEPRDARESLWPAQRSIGWLVVEKLPMLVLVVVASLWTLALQQGGSATELTAELTPGQRAANGAIAVWRYVGKLILPVGLSPFYTHPRSWPTGWVIAATVLLVATALAAVLLARRKPYLLVGLCWFLGMLFPVSGVLVHAGRQSIADRYLYLAGFGVLLAAMWAIADWLKVRPRLRLPTAVLTIVASVALAGATARYQSLWQNDLSLYLHALDVDPDNWFAHQVVGRELRLAGQPELAAIHFRRSLAIEPGNHQLRLEHATMLLLMSPAEANEAALEFHKLVQAAPDLQGTWVGLGRAELAAGRPAESNAAFAEAARRWPQDADVLAQWAVALLKQNRQAEARQKAELALRVDPKHEVARVALGMLR